MLRLTSSSTICRKDLVLSASHVQEEVPILRFLAGFHASEVLMNCRWGYVESGSESFDEKMCRRLPYNAYLSRHGLAKTSSTRDRYSPPQSKWNREYNTIH